MGLILNSPIQHHYVPQVYLSFFESSEKPGSVYFYRRGAGPRLVSTRKVAKERHLYSFTDKAGKLNTFVETALSKLESDVKPILVRLNAAKESISLSTDETSLLFTFISVQAARTPAFRKVIKQMSVNLAQMTLQQAVQNIDWLRDRLAEQNQSDITAEELQEFILDDSKYTIETDGDYYLLEQLRLQMEIHKAISIKNPVLLKSEESPFITSDFPVTLVKDPRAPSYYGAGFLTSTIYLPLGQHTCLLLVNPPVPECSDPSEMWVGLSKIPPSKVRWINKLMVHSAEKYLFASNYNQKIQKIFDATTNPERVEFSSPFTRARKNQ